MKTNIIILSFLFLSLILISQINAIDSTRQDRLDFGYVLYVNNATTNPVNLAPGKEGVIKITIENKARFPIYDIRMQLTLPNSVSFLDDISKRKIAEIGPGEIKEIDYNIITEPKASEGIYSASYSIDYLNNLGTEREENDSFGIVIKATPKIFAEIESSTIYEQNLVGDVTINFINNNVANVKFLTVELQDSPDYEIISSQKNYVGDLDSNDFQSADFKLNVLKKSGSISLPVKVTYKDSFNNDFSEDFNLPLQIRSSEQLGIKMNYTWVIVIAVILVVIILYIIFSRLNRRKTRER